MINELLEKQRLRDVKQRREDYVRERRENLGLLSESFRSQSTKVSQGNNGGSQVDGMEQPEGSIRQLAASESGKVGDRYNRFLDPEQIEQDKEAQVRDGTPPRDTKFPEEALDPNFVPDLGLDFGDVVKQAIPPKDTKKKKKVKMSKQEKEAKLQSKDKPNPDLMTGDSFNLGTL